MRIPLKSYNELNWYNPAELAQMAGVDITTDQPLLDTIEYIGNMIDEIIGLSEEIG